MVSLAFSFSPALAPSLACWPRSSHVPCARAVKERNEVAAREYILGYWRKKRSTNPATFTAPAHVGRGVLRRLVVQPIRMAGTNDETGRSWAASPSSVGTGSEEEGYSPESVNLSSSEGSKLEPQSESELDQESGHRGEGTSPKRELDTEDVTSRNKVARRENASEEEQIDLFPEWRSQVRTWEKATRGVRWWDGYMSKGVRNVQDIQAARVLVEIRDARIPRSSVHPLFEKWKVEMKLVRVIVYTHSDLVPLKELRKLKKWTVQNITEADNIFFKDLSDYKTQKPKTHNDFRKRLYDLLMKHGSDIDFLSVKKAIVCGIPNVGKSSLIHVLSKEETKKLKKKGMYHAPKVKNIAGETKNIKSHWFNERPAMMLVDTPGMFLPTVDLDRHPETYYKLAITGKINHADLKDQREVIEYLLYRLNRARLFQYVKLFEMDGPTDDVDEFIQSTKQPTVRAATPIILRYFLRGELGKLCLDDIETPLPEFDLETANHSLFEQNSRRPVEGQLSVAGLRMGKKKKNKRHLDGPPRIRENVWFTMNDIINPTSIKQYEEERERRRAARLAAQAEKDAASKAEDTEEEEEEDGIVGHDTWVYQNRIPFVDEEGYSGEKLLGEPPSGSQEEANVSLRLRQVAEVTFLDDEALIFHADSSRTGVGSNEVEVMPLAVVARDENVAMHRVHRPRPLHY